MADNLLSVKGLKTYFHTQHGVARAVDGVNFSLGREETLGIVGESGSGKSVTMLSIMRLIYPPGKIESGRVLFDGRDLMNLSMSEMRKIRGNKISMIFQEPMTSLNPLFRIGEQVSEAIRLHQGLGKKDALERSVEMLKEVGIPSPEKRVRDYPHQLSGGMRQRAMIAMAMSCRPMLMIADEPTTALDVTIQAQILDVIQKLMEQTKMSMILITHNMGVVAETVQRVMVMYAGKAMELGPVEEVFESPYHPYTESLLKSIPGTEQNRTQKRLHVIPGIVPDLTDLPSGCRFRDRCSKTLDKCLGQEPEMHEVAPGRFCRCWLHGENQAIEDSPGQESAL
jgi:peptide/nickel transport system ATP-binding protein/oligopeptide transport system ATP-binding protein